MQSIKFLLESAKNEIGFQTLFHDGGARQITGYDLQSDNPMSLDVLDEFGEAWWVVRH